MEVFEAIAKRHSYRGQFKNQEISRDDLRRIVQAGIQAPSGCNAQTTTFVIVDDPQIVAQIREMRQTFPVTRLKSGATRITGILKKPRLFQL